MPRALLLCVVLFAGCGSFDQFAADKFFDSHYGKKPEWKQALATVRKKIKEQLEDSVSLMIGHMDEDQGFFRARYKVHPHDESQYGWGMRFYVGTDRNSFGAFVGVKGYQAVFRGNELVVLEAGPRHLLIHLAKPLYPVTVKTKRNKPRAKPSKFLDG